MALPATPTPTATPRPDPVPPRGASHPRPGVARLVAGVVLVVVGLLVWLLAGLRGRDEARSYEGGAPPPATVSVTSGHTYSLGTTGGLAALRGVVSPQSLRCTLSVRGGASQPLAISAEANDKALHRIATFVAPVTGRVHVACPDAGDVYVDDPDGGVDVAGLLRILATLVLAVGVPLAVSGLAATQPRRAGAAG